MGTWTLWLSAQWLAGDLARTLSSAPLNGPFCGMGGQLSHSLWKPRLKGWPNDNGSSHQRCGRLKNSPIPQLGKLRTNLISRRDLYLLVGYLSGHHLMNIHLTKMRSSEDACILQAAPNTSCAIVQPWYELGGYICTWKPQEPKHIVHFSTNDLLCIIREGEQLLLR